LALQLRSNARVGEAPLAPDQELDYPIVLNRVLPPEIRVLGWCPVDAAFSAR
jgi:tRNA pseudouridine38/39 synthase